MTLIDDAASHAVHAPMRVHGSNINGGNPPRGAGKPSSPGSTKVAWTLRSGDKIVAVHDFSINPQAITRVESSRASVFATKGGFYVDDFGAGPSTITLRQIVATGHWISAKHGLREVLTAREDVQRFIRNIYKPATRPMNGGRLQVYFHDNHMEQGHDERVFFPQNALSIQRSVDMPNVWLLELQMVGLEKNPFSDVEVERTSNRHHRKYVVKRGDTLHSIVVRLAGAHSTKKKRKHVLSALLKLNPAIRRKRTLHVGATNFLGDHTVTAKPMHVVPGEIIVLPTTTPVARATGDGALAAVSHATGDGALAG